MCSFLPLLFTILLISVHHGNAFALFGGVKLTAASRSTSHDITFGIRAGSSSSAENDNTAIAPTSTDDYNVTDKDLEILANELAHCPDGVIDTHLHIASWFDNGEELAAGLEENNVSIGMLYNPYPKVAMPFDINERVHSIASSSNGRVFCLASLNTTHDNWEDHKEFELNRLVTYLHKDESVLGVKLAPPHTCLKLNSIVVDDIIETIHEKGGDKKVLAIHIGTTPFCGPIGKMFNLTCLCSEEFVDPRLLERHVKKYPDITFALLHSGHEFLPPSDDCYHDFKYAHECISMAKQYPNVYLSMSAIFAQNPDGSLKYPGGAELVKKMKDAGVAHKVFWGSDQSFIKESIKPALIVAIKAMIDAGYSQEERTWALNGCARKVFGIPKK